MGSVVGEKLTRLIERATEQQLPLIIISGSGGGARMHEGVLSLMQMAKVSAALARFDQAGGLFISVLTNPTMGGVAASFAALGDLVFAEPKALIGFAGPRTIKATIRIELPKGFQTSEFLMEHGFLDRIVRRADLKSALARSSAYCGKRRTAMRCLATNRRNSQNPRIFRGFRCFVPLLAIVRGGLLHRSLHRSCTGFCTASRRCLKVAFKGVAIVGVSNLLRVTKPSCCDEAGVLRGQFRCPTCPAVDERLFPRQQSSTPNDGYELGP